MILIVLIERGIKGRFTGSLIMRTEAIIEAGVLAVLFKAGLII
jgi:hypothetical protein